MRAINLDADLTPILIRYEYRQQNLVQILREVQALCGFLSPEAIDYLATQLKLPRAQIEGVASFYTFFHLQPQGRYRILFADNITDQMLGNHALQQRLCRHFGIQTGQVSQDGLLSVDFTSCTGMCDQGPAILVNGLALTCMTNKRIDDISELIRTQTPLECWPQSYFKVSDNIHRKDAMLGENWLVSEPIRAALARGAEGMIAEMKLSNLRGRGGAGFTTAVKWESARHALCHGDNPIRYIVCNADEGEPGTFKDRVLLNSYADLLFDGMTVAAFAVGAAKGLLYLRGEYLYLLPQLQANLEKRRISGLLGHAVCGQQNFGFDIQIHVGAGAYVCGEETALLESLEGKRGVPRVRPPFPVTCGYLGQPTVVNNVETLCKAATIALKGGVWFAGLGTKQSTGTKLISVSGDVAAPGIYEYPFGISVAQVLKDSGAKEPQAVQISGASGICLAEHEFTRRIAFEDVPTAGAFMVFNAHRDMFEVARNFAHFFAHESCGFCTPCRIGTALTANMMDKIAKGYGSQHDINELYALHRLMSTVSHCGLGQAACNPIIDTLLKFRPTYERRLRSLDFVPAFDLDQSLAAACELTGRDDAGTHLSQHMREQGIKS